MITGEVHPMYTELMAHSYFDEKNWSREQRYTFEQTVLRSYKDVDGRYVIPLIFNEKVKHLSNSDNLAKGFWVFRVILGYPRERVFMSWVMI